MEEKAKKSTHFKKGRENFLLDNPASPWLANVREKCGFVYWLARVCQHGAGKCGQPYIDPKRRENFVVGQCAGKVRLTIDWSTPASPWLANVRGKCS